ncbi:hypothetical protein CGCF415_v004168 [Colletotrichum fructicola]|nr:uncharacterized protein CGMCC3_g2147 [Colletotrichum fructicola]KAE9581609.1 hypothetical protein CGMCC3_g2147 [Colletotrichum fructicola]KAF4881600.1 hypothetical protein CGCFRS4_v015385 [Colletotrichum fructicola]KAF4911761.1 hypothetical protein CGCF415_v004168 [Colletotrichum fructicola]KAF4941993.1 hypothetical protein CGCF245_v001201 [Colletotrichum fructicola]
MTLSTTNGVSVFIEDDIPYAQATGQGQGCQETYSDRRGRVVVLDLTLVIGVTIKAGVPRLGKSMFKGFTQALYEIINCLRGRWNLPRIEIDIDKA